MSRTDVIEINRIEDLQPYHLAWSALHADTPGATFFQTLEWLTTYWKHQGEGKRLRVLIVRCDGRPIGIVPLCEITEFGRLGPLRVLTYPLSEWSSVFSPIGRFQTASLAIAFYGISPKHRGHGMCSSLAGYPTTLPIEAVLNKPCVSPDSTPSRPTTGKPR